MVIKVAKNTKNKIDAIANFEKEKKMANSKMAAPKVKKMRANQRRTKSQTKPPKPPQEA